MRARGGCGAGRGIRDSCRLHGRACKPKERRAQSQSKEKARGAARGKAGEDNTVSYAAAAVPSPSDHGVLVYFGNG